MLNVKKCNNIKLLLSIVILICSLLISVSCSSNKNEVSNDENTPLESNSDELVDEYVYIGEIFPDYITSAKHIVYIVTINNNQKLYYGVLESLGTSVKCNIFESIVNVLYKTNPLNSCESLYRKTIGEPDKEYALDEVLSDRVASLRDKEPIIKVVGLDLVECVGEDAITKAYEKGESVTIESAEEVYRIDIYDQEWVIYRDDEPVFYQVSGAPILDAVLSNWETLTPSEGMPFDLSGNLTF